MAHSNLIVGSTCGAGRVWLFISFPFGERKGKGGEGNTRLPVGLASSGRSLPPGCSKPTSKGETLTIILARLLAGQGRAAPGVCFSCLTGVAFTLLSYRHNSRVLLHISINRLRVVFYNPTYLYSACSAFFLSVPPFLQSFFLSFHSIALSLHRIFHHTLSFLLFALLSHALSHTLPPFLC